MNESKTPRDWLLARHQSAVHALDARRQAALPTGPFTWRDFLREVFRPHRAAWTVLGATWIALAIFHLTLVPTIPNSKVPPPSPEAVAAWIARLKSSHDTFAQIDRMP